MERVWDTSVGGGHYGKVLDLPTREGPGLGTTGGSIVLGGRDNYDVGWWGSGGGGLI